MQKARCAAEDVPAQSEAVEDLRIFAVEKFTAHLEGVLAKDQGEVVLELEVPEGLARPRPKEEWLTEAERGEEAHAGIRHSRGADSRTRPCLVSVGDVRLVEAAGAQCRNQVEVECLDVGRAFDAVGSRAVGGDVKGLVGVPRIVEVIGSEELVPRVDRVVHATEESAVIDVVIYRQAFILTEVGLVEVDEYLSLAIAVGINLGVGDVRAKDGIGDRARG